MDNKEVLKEYNKEQQWYTTSQISHLFQISKTICKKRIKLNKSLLEENQTIISIKSKKGKDTNLYHFSILNDIFGLRKKPAHLTDKIDKMNYIGTSKWDYIGFITPKRSSISDLKHKMNYFHNQLILHYGKKSGIKVFYSIEPNPIDNYFHCHFLINSKDKITDSSLIKELLEIISGEKSKYETPFILRQYDYLNFGYSGSFYSFKERSVYDELMG
jgi:hypothetical protein